MVSQRCDPEFLAGLHAEMAALPKESPPEHDFQARRKVWELVQIHRNALIPETADTEVTTHHVSVTGEHKIKLYGVRPSSLVPKSSNGWPAILFAHGGGMVLGTADYSVKRLAIVAAKCQVQIFSVDYRLAPEWPHPTPTNDCYSALEWLIANAAQLDVDPSRIGLMGESAGGGLMAAVALEARDNGLQPALAKQLLLSPMLDDRTIRGSPELEKFACWKYHNNLVAWGALLGGADKVGSGNTDPYAAPGRAKSVARLPSTYIEVGNLDIFREEVIEFARRLLAEDIDCELHVYSGVGHSFEYIAPMAAVSIREMESLCAAVRCI